MRDKGGATAHQRLKQSWNNMNCNIKKIRVAFDKNTSNENVYEYKSVHEYESLEAFLQSEETSKNDASYWWVKKQYFILFQDKSPETIGMVIVKGRQVLVNFPDYYKTFICSDAINALKIAQEINGLWLKSFLSKEEFCRKLEVRAVDESLSLEPFAKVIISI